MLNRLLPACLLLAPTAAFAADPRAPEEHFIEFERLPDADPNDGSTVEVERRGHTWPGGTQYMPKFVVGSVNHDFSASAAIVDFFSAH